jgi:pimeloyl-ACP methyl ester carboxylesterase
VRAATRFELTTALFVALLPALLVVQPRAASTAASGPGFSSALSQRITLRTLDGVTIAATWHDPSSRPAPAVILVHMLGRSRQEWEGVAARLAAEGTGVLAIDLRGHGESSGDAAGDYTSMLKDLAAARQHLAVRPDVVHGRIGVAGASLGANLAVLAAADDTTIGSLALLSPSLEYRGLRSEAALRKYGGRPALLVVSDDDPYAMRSAKDLQKAGPGVRELVVLNGAGHGTNMLSRSPDLGRTLVDWFRRTLQ